MALAVALLVTAGARAHDLFMKLDSYFLAPNTRASVRLLNGTFQKSDGRLLVTVSETQPLCSGSKWAHQPCQ